METKIREFREADLPEVYQLIINTISTSYAGVYPQEAIDFFKDYHNRKNILNDAAAGYMIIAWQGEKIVGTGTLYGTNIRWVFIDPSCQGQGIGQRIVDALEGKAREKNLNPVDLSASLVSRPFWEKLGYTVKEEYYLPVDNARKLHFYEMVKNGM